MDPVNEFPYPVVLPLKLAGEELERYFEVRTLRRSVDPTGETSIYWDETGKIRKGQRYPRPGVYSFPPPTEAES